MFQTHRRVAAGVLVASALLLSACGTDEAADEKDTATTEATTTTEAAEDTTTTEAEVDDDAQARAESVDITVSDFPDGWTSSPAEPEDDSDPGIADCSDVFSDDATLAEFDTDDFSSGDMNSGEGAMFAASTKVFASEDEAQAVLDALNDDDVISCISTTLEDLIGGGQIEVSGSMEQDDTDLGTDGAEGISGEYTLDIPELGPTTAQIGVLIFRTGDIATMVNILALGEFDYTELGQPLQALVEAQQAA